MQKVINTVNGLVIAISALTFLSGFFSQLFAQPNPVPVMDGYSCTEIVCGDVSCNACGPAAYCSLSELTAGAWWKCYPHAGENCTEPNSAAMSCRGFCPNMNKLCECTFGGCTAPAE